MKPLPTPLVLFALACLLPARARGIETVLDADFDDKTIDLPIGLGGAIVGEPMSITGTTAFVKEWPLTTPNLKINDDDLSQTEAGYVKFELLDSAILLEGTVVISFDIQFQAYEDYVFLVRDRRGNRFGKKYLDLLLGSSGNVLYRDDDTPVATLIGTYQVGRLVPVRFTFDLDAGIYDLEFDGVALLSGETHGVVPPAGGTVGIGAVFFGMQADDDPFGEYNIDNLLVTVEQTTGVEPRAWAGVKSLYR